MNAPHRISLALTIVACAAINSTIESIAADEGGKYRDYASRVKPLLKAKCYACHGASKQEGELRLDSGQLIRKGGDSGSVIDIKRVDTSLILQRVTAEDPDERMPPKGEPLTVEQVAMLRAWIAGGGKSPANETAQIDPRRHWAFQPLQSVRPPPGSGHPIDRFVERKRRQAGIRGVEPATAETLVRRLFLDLHGLPPTLQELRHWSSRLRTGKANGKGETNNRPAVDQRVLRRLIDKLLDSPRYGERWAQHWLDVVRYADTHGFEVNTPRPNAWPYRDYVIRAFNSDKTYDRFVFEQLAGDSVGQDAATGFMVAAAVLLPGQIGADDVSKRLARQDSLDEIVVGTSATFLGLTVGCARCHDHKFDPVTQRDYYAMQAFFAGVEYGDRPLRDGSQKERQTRAARYSSRIAELTTKLRAYQPSAFPGRTIVVDDEDLSRVTLLKKKNGHGTNPAGKERGYADDPGSEDRVANISRRRYTWWPNNIGQDTFTWNPAVEGRFQLWISWGAHGSGVHTRDARYVLDRDGDLKTRNDQREIAQVDQHFLSGVSSGTSEKKPLWSGLLNVGIYNWTKTTRLILRGGKTGTGITADAIVLQEIPPLAGGKTSNSPPSLPALRDPVKFTHNVDKFADVKAKFIRFTTLETTNKNRYEPCIDELEVYRAGDADYNVALATHGTKATSSGNRMATGIHQIKHINDGKYGNSWSWMSKTKGGGWVQLEFPALETINRVEWGRDRDGKFKDRLPVRYSIDVSEDGKHWTSVARSDDRTLLGTPADGVQSLLRGALGSGNSSVAKSVAELTELKRKKSDLEKPRMVYAGKFRAPDRTRLLHRGDPEQPRDDMAPHVPRVLGSLALKENDSEQQRRIQLAQWIAAKNNSLTARVMVNRVWQYHFGRGIVETASDFGTNGAAPSHPQMLDWLAAEWTQRGWSLKQLHRLILTSATYQQSSRVDPEAQKRDADCKLLWRFPSRRMEAEAIRDSMLYVGGQLNLEMGGPGFDFFKSRGGLSGFPPVDSFSRSQMRRMVYAHKIRMERVPVFGAFDCPDAGQATPKRSQSTTPIQALNLFNSRFVIDQAEKFSERAAMAEPAAIDRQIDYVFLAALGRKPTRRERAATLPAVKQHGLALLCRVLFNSNEFLFIP